MKRTPPALAVWCLTRMTGGQRGDAILGDLLERFGAGETAAWFWRQTLAALAFGFSRAVREHGLSFVGALAAAALTLLVMMIVDPIITKKVIHFQTHQLLELDPDWNHGIGWQIVFSACFALQTGIWFAAAGWFAARIHRTHPRLIITVLAVLVFALHLYVLIPRAMNLMTHSRYLDVFIWTVIRTLLTTATVVVCGLWGARRNGERSRTA